MSAPAAARGAAVAGDYRRRGACPGLSAPMPTGDGLLVRLRPHGTIAPAALAALCAAARAHGNGVVEVSPRGAIQVRGLSAASAPGFAAAVAGIGIAADDGLAVITDPLAGVAAHEVLDARPHAAALRAALARGALALAPKISVAIDGGGAVGLDALAADIRLRALTADRFAVSVDGDAANANALGLVAAANAVEAVLRLLAVLAAAGRQARMRDILRREGPAQLRRAIADLLIGAAAPAPPGAQSHWRGEALGLCRLADGTFACGVGLPFGHADAAPLARLDRAVQEAGAQGWRTAARALIAIGLPADAAPGFAGAAEGLQFVVRADDARRRIVACAGAPACASGHIATRALAGSLALSLAPLLRERSLVHLSGCAKGCAHPAPAPLTIVGMAGAGALVADGNARAAPFAVVPAAALPAAIVDVMRGRGHG